MRHWEPVQVVLGDVCNQQIALQPVLQRLAVTADEVSRQKVAIDLSLRRELEAGSGDKCLLREIIGDESDLLGLALDLNK